jgi:hypothetical protein
VLGSKPNPFPIGSPALYSDGWEITVLSTTPDATGQVLAHEPTNETPSAGWQFFVASVQVRYLGTQPAAAFAAGYSLRAVGQSGTLYELAANCGVIPDEVPGDELEPGGALTGNVCWTVKAEDVPTLLMYYRPGLGVEVELQYSKLTP